MTSKTPVRVVFDGSNNATGLAEFQSGEFVPLSHGGLGASLSLGTAGQVLKVNSGATALEFSSDSGIGLTSLSVGAEASASGNGAIGYNNTTGVFTYTPPTLSGIGGDTDDVSEGSTNLYFTNERVDDRVNSLLQEGTGITLTYDDTANTLTIAGSAQYGDSDARSAISVTDSGGDGSLGYNSSTGVITYTGPSASEVRAHISGGTGVTITDGSIAIGQSVGTSDDVQFANATISGNLTVSGTTTTVSSTNTVVSDQLMELNNGQTGTPSGDIGLVMERGDSDNAFMGFDESADKFIVGTGTFTGASTGDLTITTGTLVANLEGNVTGNVTGDVTGNADTATTLETSRTIGGVSFDGSANIDLPGVNTAGTQNTTGSAATLTTARTIGGVSFDGSANIDLPGVNTAGTQNTTGSAATLTTARTIGGVSFDGSANIDLPGVNTAGNQNTSGSAATLTTARTIGGVSFDGSANIDLPGVNTAGNQNTTGSAATLTTARTIGGVSFDGSANIDLPGVNTTGNQNTTGSAATLTTARTIAGQSFDGSANITIGLTDIGISDGSADQVLTTDGAGNFTFQDSAGGSGFSASTITTMPSSEGDFDLTKTDNAGDAETPFDSAATDAFGVAVGSLFDMMEPTGSGGTTTDLGVFT